MRPYAKLLGIISLLALALLYISAYTVSEGQRALLLKLGNIVRDDQGHARIIGPGLHFSIPLLVNVRKFDARLQTVTAQSSRILTLEQKYVVVDYYIKWRIQNFPLYLQRTSGDAFAAQNLLQQQVNDALRAAFGARTITDMVSGERVNVMALLRNSANATAKNLGIQVADVRIKSIDLPQQVSERVYSRMRTKREQVATEHRAAGKAKAESIRATADANAAISVAQAQFNAAKTRASGTAEAAAIYAEAYQQDREFYSFYRSLQAYLTAFSSKQDFLVLTPESDFFNYFNQVKSRDN